MPYSSGMRPCSEARRHRVRAGCLHKVQRDVRVADVNREQHSHLPEAEDYQ